jgi:exopolyphosphatase/guanosine-5'-triphosphate,3'-diphosphate pyrophosphatase
VKPVRRAVIDVGTNSIKLLVGEIDAQLVRPILEESRQTRLGKGFYQTHVLQPEPIAESAQAVAHFASKARELGAISTRVVATSAARDAKNQAELLAAIQQACGLPVRVITGEEEAHYAFQGVSSNPELTREPLLLLDVGGGSTEFILGHQNKSHFARSFALGTVRLLELLHLDDPPTQGQFTDCRSQVLRFLETEISPSLKPALEKEAGCQSCLQPVQLVGTGGTASILACMEAGLTAFDRERLESTRLTQSRLRWHVEHLWGLPSAERKKIVGLPPNRADVVLTGVAIYEAIMDYFGFDQLRVSTRGLRFALLTE